MFGPWEVSTRCTRGGCAYSKCCDMLFIEDMSIVSFTNAVRRFRYTWGSQGVQIRPYHHFCWRSWITEDGKHQRRWCYQWICLVGPRNNMEIQPALHMGGVWERLIHIAFWGTHLTRIHDIFSVLTTRGLLQPFLTIRTLRSNLHLSFWHNTETMVEPSVEFNTKVMYERWR